MFDVDLDTQFVEEVNVYVEFTEHTVNNSNDEGAQPPQQRCVAFRSQSL